MARAASPGLAAASLNISEPSSSGVHTGRTPSMNSFLRSLGLEHLNDILKREEITFEILLELDHAKLKDIGIHAYGHRNLLLNNMLGYNKNV